jgi:hypothetical protein
MNLVYYFHQKKKSNYLLFVCEKLDKIDEIDNNNDCFVVLKVDYSIH